MDGMAEDTTAALIADANQLTFDLLSSDGMHSGELVNNGQKLDGGAGDCVREPHLQLLSALLPQAEGVEHALLMNVEDACSAVESIFGGDGSVVVTDAVEEMKHVVNCCNCNCSLNGGDDSSNKRIDDVITCQVLCIDNVADRLATGSVKIRDALKMLWRLDSFSDEALVDNSDLVMCLKCVSILTKLYELYNEFISISLKSGSVLAKVVDEVVKLVGKEDSTTPKDVESRSVSRRKINKSKSFVAKRTLANVVLNDRGQTVLNCEEDTNKTSDSNSAKVKRIANAKKSEENNCQFNSMDHKSVRKKVSTSATNYFQPKRSPREHRPVVSSHKYSTDKTSLKIEPSQALSESNNDYDNILDPTSDTCNRCGKRFKTFGGLKIHYASHVRDDNKIACKECGKKFRKPETLEMHERIDHKGYKPHQCPHDGCERSFRLKAKLALHIKVMHEKNKPFPCPKCEKAFRTKYHLKAHDVAQHVQGDTTIGCTQCRRKFPSKEVLEIHIKTHEEEKRFVCTECNKGFKTASRLKLHEKSHDAVPSAVCPTCGKAYKHIRDLRLHEVIHEGESSYRFACGDCPRKFYRIDLLRVHQSNEKHFSQEVVGPCVSKISDLTDNSSKEKDTKPCSSNEKPESNHDKSAVPVPPVATSKRKRKQLQKQKPETNLKPKNNEPLYDCLGSPTLFPTMVPVDTVEDSSTGLEIVELTPTLTNATAITNSLYRKNSQDIPEQSFILSTKDPVITSLVNATNIGLGAPIPQTSHYSLTNQTAGIANNIYAIKDLSDRSISSFSISAGAEQIGFDVINAFINNLN